MELLNRTALVVTPKRRFMEWANRLPDTDVRVAADDLQSLRNVYLIATDDDEDLQALIEAYWEDIFDEFLNEWAPDESLWPVNRTSHMFRDWFAADWIELVVDLDPHEPVTMAEVEQTQCAMCGGALDATRVGVAFGETVHRMSAADMDAWDTVIADGGEPPLDATLLLRCCSPACALRAEDVLRKAADDKARSQS